MDEALVAFKKAQELKPEESYPANKIAEIQAEQERIAQKQSEAERLAALEEKYQKTIKRADEVFDNGDLAQAKKEYNEALSVKSEESYPKERITLIDEKLAELESIEQQYSNLITEADGLYQKEDYENAKSKYNEALAIKSEERYPKDQLAAIDKALKNQAEIRLRQEKDAANQAKYDEFIARADQFFGEKNYEKAKSNYESALGIKEDSYPTGKIAEIEDLLAALAEKQANEEKKAATDAKYLAAITQADEMFASQRFEKAKIKYEEALTYKDEAYPKSQLQEIESAMDKAAKMQERAAKEAKIQAEYIAMIQKADDAFTGEDFKTAKASYQAALKLKPNETYPVNKIDQINQILENLQISEDAKTCNY